MPTDREIGQTFDCWILLQNVSRRYLIGKRVIDIIISILGIVIFTPFLVVVSAVIMIDSRGPALFAQERVGLKGKVFRMYKFRSMVQDAEKFVKDLEHKNDVSGPMFKMKKDPRITRVGRFIRRTSIDELPQLVNVLIGDMSIVGPRPPLPREVEQYEMWQKLRLSAKPGITGLWQISQRNSVGFEEMVRLDLKYIRERSFRKDIKLILRTLPALLGDNNAF